jgi:hypothetical protein
MDRMISIDDMGFMAQKIYPISLDKRSKIAVFVENSIVRKVKVYLQKHSFVEIEIYGEEKKYVVSDIGVQSKYRNKDSTVLIIIFNVYFIRK